MSCNIDGVPVFASINKSMRPVLCAIENISDVRPFVVTIYCGSVKPSIRFLDDFIEELKTLVTQKFAYNGRLLPLRIKYVV